MANRRKDKKSLTDTERLDALEKYIQQRPLTLWDGNGDFPGKGFGLSLRRGKNLRLAIDQALLANQ